MTVVGERVNDNRGKEEYLDNETILYVDCGADYAPIFFCQNSKYCTPKGEKIESYVNYAS